MVNPEQLQKKFYKLLPLLAARARRARQRAISWRNFRVGCAVLAYSAEGRWKVFTGFNVKRAGDSRDGKVCAEVIAIYAAMKAGYDRIIGMVIVGKPEPESLPTLRPCRECRLVFKALRMRPETLVVTISSEDSNRVEVHTFETLLRVNGDG